MLTDALDFSPFGTFGTHTDRNIRQCINTVVPKLILTANPFFFLVSITLLLVISGCYDFLHKPVTTFAKKTVISHVVEYINENNNHLKIAFLFCNDNGNCVLQGADLKRNPQLVWSVETHYS